MYVGRLQATREAHASSNGVSVGSSAFLTDLAESMLRSSLTLHRFWDHSSKSFFS